MIKIFADGADLDVIESMNKNKMVSGFTSNPTLMKKAGITDYLSFMKDALSIVGEKPFSFEVFSDDHDEMEEQAMKIHELRGNVYVKIPVTNTMGMGSYGLVRKLSLSGVKVNITAVTTFEQIELSSSALENNTPSIISIFAGRIADAGINPLNHMIYALSKTKKYNKQEILWASTREVYNYIQAKDNGVNIITMTSDLIDKIKNIGEELSEVSLRTVQMFRKDAIESNFTL